MPWTVFWERNYFLEGTALGALLRPHAVRGAISGVGVVCITAALMELWDIRPRRFRRTDTGEAAQASLEGAPER